MTIHSSGPISHTVIGKDNNWYIPTGWSGCQFLCWCDPQVLAGGSILHPVVESRILILLGHWQKAYLMNSFAERFSDFFLSTLMWKTYREKTNKPVIDIFVIDPVSVPQYKVKMTECCTLLTTKSQIFVTHSIYMTVEFFTFAFWYPSNVTATLWQSYLWVVHGELRHTIVDGLKENNPNDKQNDIRQATRAYVIY